MAAFPFATAERFSSLMENPEVARLWLAGLGVRDSERGFRDLRDLAGRGVGRWDWSPVWPSSSTPPCRAAPTRAWP